MRGQRGPKLQRLHWQREQGRGAETDALTLLQTVRNPAHVNAAFQSFFTLIKERRVLLREVDVEDVPGGLS